MTNFDIRKDLPALFRQSTDRHPLRPAIRSPQGNLTFEDVEGLSNSIAAGLAARGITKGERVALFCPNSAEFALAWLAVIKTGATVVPLNLMLGSEELSYILNDAGAGALIYHAALSDKVAAFRSEANTVKQFVGIGGLLHPNDTSWTALLECASPAPQPEFEPDKDLACLIYTSGTTGRPKGAMLSHRNLASNAASVAKALSLNSSDCFLVALPMFHAFGSTVGMLTPLLHGQSFAPVAGFDPELLLDTIAATHCTIFPAVPSIYGLLLGGPEKWRQRFSTIRYCISGGAALPPALMEAFEARFGVPVYEGYGPTECSPVTHVNPIGGLRKPGRVGLPLPGVEMEIRSPTGEILEEGEIGEICIRGPNVMRGYWQRPEATQESFWNDWFRTGDLGLVDEDGYTRVVDRIKDLIIVNGMNVYPSQVEAVLYRHADIAEAAVVGQPDERRGENVIAFVSLKEGATASPTDIRRHCQEILGSHQVPRRVIVLATLPKNATGKILKRELRHHPALTPAGEAEELAPA